MGKIKNFVKAVTPPIIFSAIRRLIMPNQYVEIWSGDYASWNDARANCSGYDSAIILEKVKSAMLKVKNREAVYERDSLLFDEIQYSWGLLAGLQRAASENEGELCVLDFGGSLGSTYFQNKEFLSTCKALKWCIVEQSHFVQCGKENFEDEHLKFFNTIEECLENFQPNVLLLSSVLQYLENPYEWINKFRKLNIPYIILDRTAFIEEEDDLLTIQNVPAAIYQASYPAWFFGHKMKRLLFKDKSLIIEFNSMVPSNVVINAGLEAAWVGVILRK